MKIIKALLNIHLHHLREQSSFSLQHRSQSLSARERLTRVTMTKKNEAPSKKRVRKQLRITECLHPPYYDSRWRSIFTKAIGASFSLFVVSPRSKHFSSSSRALCSLRRIGLYDEHDRYRDVEAGNMEIWADRRAADAARNKCKFDAG